jgi:hypothetical protein
MRKLRRRPANIFDTPFLAWDTEKTDAPVTIPWSVIPALQARIEAAKLRHRQSPIRATTFFVDDVGQRPWSSNRFFSAFSRLRAELAKRHEGFPTKYAVKHYTADPTRIPTRGSRCARYATPASRPCMMPAACANRFERSLGTRSPASTRCSTVTQSSRLTRQGQPSNDACRTSKALWGHSSIALQAITKSERNVSRKRPKR